MNEELIEKVNNYLTKQFICEPSYLPEDECETEAKYLITLISAEARKQERERIIKDVHSIEFESDSVTDFLNKTLYYLKALKEGGKEVSNG